MDGQIQQACSEIAKCASLILGETRGFWIQTSLVLIGAVAALLAVWSSRIIERRKAAADVIFQSRRDNALVDGLKTITTIHNDDDKNVRRFAKKEHAGTNEAKALRYVLNHYEYISVGIQEKIYDEMIFKKSSFSTLTKVYDRTKPFIDALRAAEQRPTIYQEFEWLACRWKDNPLKTKTITGRHNSQ